MISPASHFSRHQPLSSPLDPAKPRTLPPTRAPQSWLDLPERVTDWINSNSLSMGRAVTTPHKVRMIRTLMCAELPAQNLIALLRLLQAVHLFSEAEQVRDHLELSQIENAEQRKSVGLALAGLPR